MTHDEEIIDISDLVLQAAPLSTDLTIDTIILIIAIPVMAALSLAIYFRRKQNFTPSAKRTQ